MQLTITCDFYCRGRNVRVELLQHWTLTLEMLKCPLTLTTLHLAVFEEAVAVTQLKSEGGLSEPV